MKKYLILSTVFWGVLGLCDDGIRCLYVNSQGELQLNQSAHLSVLKKAKRKMSIFGLPTETLIDVLEWETEFKPSFLDSNIETLKSKLVTSFSEINLTDNGIQLSGKSELSLDPNYQVKIKRAQGFERIDSINKQNQEFGFELSPEQSNKILEKYATTKVEFMNSESILRIFEEQDLLFEALTEFIPHYMFTLNQEQKEYLQGILPESKTESKEEQSSRIEKSIEDLEEKTLSDAEIALFNLSSEIEEHLSRANSIFYLSEIPEVQKNERLSYDLDRLYICETPKTIKLPQPKADNPSEPQEKKESLKPKKKPAPNGLNV